MSETMSLRAPEAPAGIRPGPAPRVSVVIPVYNASATIGAALDSVLTQRPAPFEIVVSDDGSGDNLDGALRPFLNRIQLVRGPNTGPEGARNRAAAVASGDLLALLDADDVWLPGRLRALSDAAAARPDLDVLTTDAIIVRNGVPDPQTFYATREFYVSDQAMGILRNSFVFGCGAIRTSVFRAFGGYRDCVHYAEDWDLWLRLLLRGRRAGLIDEPLYEYRRSSHSLTGNKVDLAVGVLAALALAHPLVSNRAQRHQLEITEQQWRESGARAAGSLNDPRARRMAWRAAAGIRARPRARARFAAAALLPSSVLAKVAAR